MSLSRRSFITGGLAAAGLAAAGAFNMAGASPAKTVFPSHEPLGHGQGINPGRVVWTHNPDSVHWTGVDFWWKPENYNQADIMAMIRQGIMDLTSQPTPAQAWNALFDFKHRGGYKSGQKIAVKTNMNGAGEYNDDPKGHHAAPYGNPLLLQTLLLSLVEDASVKPGDITVFDTCRIFPDYMREMCTSGKLAGVSFRQRDPGGSTDAIADKNALIEWADGVSGKPTYFPQCITEATYLINLASLKGHSWGMTLGAKNHFGSFVNSDRRRTPAAAGLHPNIIHGEMGCYSVLADLNARKQLNGKTILWMLDALITAPSETGNISPDNSRWKMEPFNGHYAASLFFSQDPMAIDSVGADFLVNEPVMLAYNRGLAHTPAMENYLHEGALLGRPPSGVRYTDGEGSTPASLGVHEHWNNPKDKKYSRNLGASEGIELVYHKM